MADIELDAATTAAYLEIVGGRRVIVLSQLGGRDRVILQLPTKDPSRPLQRLALQFAQLADRTRSEARHDVHRGFVIVAPHDMTDGHGGPVSGAG